MRGFLIVALSMVGIILLILFWVWRFVFKKSLRKMIFIMMGIMQNSDELVDPDAEILPSMEKHSSDVLDDKAAEAKQQSPFEPPQATPKANMPSDDTTQDTSDNGWPRQLDYETRHEKHPFRQVHLRTDNEQTHEIMDVDTYQPPEIEADSQSE